MSVNRFDGVGFVRSMSQSARDLQAINNAWPNLSWFHRKRIFLWFMFEVMKQKAGRAVVMSDLRAAAVSALRATWCRLRTRVIVPTAGGLSWSQLYALTTKQERQDILIDLLRTIEKRRRREYLRAVIVSACVRAWVISSAVIVPTVGMFGDLAPAGYVLFMLTCYAGR